MGGLVIRLWGHPHPALLVRAETTGAVAGQPVRRVRIALQHARTQQDPIYVPVYHVTRCPKANTRTCIRPPPSRRRRRLVGPTGTRCGKPSSTNAYGPACGPRSGRWRQPAASFWACRLQRCACGHLGSRAGATAGRVLATLAPETHAHTGKCEKCASRYTTRSVSGVPASMKMPFAPTPGGHLSSQTYCSDSQIFQKCTQTLFKPTPHRRTLRSFS